MLTWGRGKREEEEGRVEGLPRGMLRGKENLKGGSGLVKDMGLKCNFHILLG